MGELSTMLNNKEQVKVLSESVKAFAQRLNACPDDLIGHYKVKTWIHELVDSIIIDVGFTDMGMESERGDAVEVYEKARMSKDLRDLLTDLFNGMAEELEEAIL